MAMPNRIFHTMYRSAWMESEVKRKEAEEAEKQARKEEQQAKRSGGGGGQTAISSRQAIEKMRGISGEDIEELAEETGLV